MSNEDEKKAPANHRVKVNVGYTRNMGNFESLRVDVGLELDSAGNPTVTFEKAYNWAEQTLLDKMNEVEEQMKDAKE